MINNTCPNLLLFKNRKFSFHVKRKNRIYQRRVPTFHESNQKLVIERFEIRSSANPKIDV